MKNVSRFFLVFFIAWVCLVAPHDSFAATTLSWNKFRTGAKKVGLTNTEISALTSTATGAPCELSTAGAPKGILPGADRDIIFNLGAGDWIPVVTTDIGALDLWMCPKDLADDIPADDSLHTIVTFIIWIISKLIEWAIFAALWLLGIASIFTGFFLNQGLFINHPVVLNGWPFLLGVANLLFIVALIAIAVSTSLQFEAFNARRLLPKLLIGALLINFSLIIGGLLTDTARLLMSLLINLVGAGNLQNLGGRILVSSGTFSGLTKISDLVVTAPDYNTWSIPLVLLKAFFIAAFMTAAMVFLAVFLAIRYIMLILLLTVSPLPYLALGFPGMSQWHGKWWGSFLKWVFVGPVILFFLVLIAKIGGGVFINTSDNIFTAITSVTITAVLIFASVGFAKKIGGASAFATMKTLGRYGKKVGWQAYNRTPLVRSTVLGTRDMVANATSPVTDRVARTFKLGKYSTYDKNGNLRDPGKPTKMGAAGAKIGRQVGGVLGGATQRRQQKTVKDINKDADDLKTGAISTRSHSLLQPQNLFDPNIVSQLHSDILGAVLTKGGDNQQRALIDALSKLSAKDGTNLAKDQIKAILGSGNEKAISSIAGNKSIVGSMGDDEKDTFLKFVVLKEATQQKAKPALTSAIASDPLALQKYREDLAKWEKDSKRISDILTTFNKTVQDLEKP